MPFCYGLQQGVIWGVERRAADSHGGPMVKFIESFEFPWVDWGCCSFIDPVFSYDNR